MIAVKYEKQGSSAFISHIDILRHITRSIRRADIDINYSQGYNPHMLIKMSAPCPIGIKSRAEYFTLDTKVPAGEFITRYNTACVKDLTAVKAWNITKNPNFQGILRAADYSVRYNPGAEIIKDILNRKEFIIKYISKGVAKVMDVRALILDLRQTDDCFMMRLSSGADTLRPDRLIEAINAEYSTAINVTDIIKTEQYC